MSPQQLFPAITTSSTTTTTSRRTTNMPTPPPPRKSSSTATTTKSASADDSTTTTVVSLLPLSLSSVSWKRFNLRFVLLTSLLCLAVLHSILQGSAGIFVVTPSPPAPPSSTMIQNEIDDDINEHENTMNVVDDSSHIISRGGIPSFKSTPRQQPAKETRPEHHHSRQRHPQHSLQPQLPPAALLLLQPNTTQSSLETVNATTAIATISNNSTTPSASRFAALEPISRGTAQVRHPVINDTTTATTTIPKIIWMFWDTGWPANNHPGANMNRRSWELANPSFTVHALDGPTAERLTNRNLHVPDERWQVLHVQAKSDVYRTLLLQKYGGIWADCNVFCNRPVQDWVDLNSTDVVSFRRIDNLSEQVKKGIQPWITSWFLAAPPASYTVAKVSSVISDPDEHYRFRAQYFWWHHIVAQIANTDSRVNDLIQSYTAPWTCSGKDWQSQGTALKRCANKSMPPIIYTTEQCCPAIGGRPHIMNSDTTIQNNSIASMTADSVKQQQKLMVELCSQWNCTVQAENLERGNAIRKLWGSERIRTLNDDYFDP